MEEVSLRAFHATRQGRGAGPRTPGFTLVEVLVAASLLLVLMTMVYQVVAPSMRLINKAESDTETQQAVLLALDRIFVALRLTDPRSVTVMTNPAGVAFLSPRPPAQAGLPALTDTMYQLAGVNTAPATWRLFEVLYHDATRGLLLRKQAPYPGGTQVARMTPVQVQTFLADPRYPVRTVGRNVKRLRISRPRPPGVLVDATSVIETTGKPRETRLLLAIAPRN